MAQTIKLRRSSTSGAVPTTSSLSLGEVAINTYDGKMYIKKDDGSESVVEVGVNSTIAATTLTGNLSMGDNVRARFGTGNDLQIYHDGSHSRIKDTGTGNLILNTQAFRVNGADDSEGMIKANQDGNVELYYDGLKKIETTSNGVEVTGANGNLTIGAQNTTGFHIYTDRSRFYFNKRLSLIENILTSYDNNLQLQTQGATKLTLNSTGIAVTGSITASGTVDGVDIAARDAILTSTTTTAEAALPKAGGTMTGALTIAGGSSVADLYINNTSPTLGFTDSNSFSDNNDIYIVRGTSTGKLQFQFFDDSANTTTQTFLIDQTGNATFSGSVTATNTILNTGSTTVSTILRGGDGNSKNLVFQKTTGSAQQAKISAVGDDLRFTTGTTTERMRINSSGNIGIGTTSPTARLDVRSPNGGVHSRGQLYLTNTDSHAINQGSQISLGGTYSGTGDTYLGSIAARKENATSGDYAGYLQFGTRPSGAANVERMRITSTGNVGIGTTAPGTPLDVQSNSSAEGIRVRGRSSDSIGQITLTNNSGNARSQLQWNDSFFNIKALAAIPMIFYTNSTERMRIQSSGNVGIGTTSPTAQLHVKSAGNGEIEVERTSGALINLQAQSAAGYIGTDSNHLFGLKANGTVRLKIATGGAISFNDAFTFPTADGSANQVLKTDGSGNMSWVTVAGVGNATIISDADNDTKIQVEESADEDKIRFDAAGVERFRIGSDIEVIAATDFNITGTNRRLNFTSGTGTVRTTGASNLNFGTSNTDRMTITSAGKVGIGTSSPDAKLSIHSSVGADPHTGDASLELRDTGALAVENGGSIIFSAVYTGTSGYIGSGPYIKAYKLNATDGDYSYGLKFATRENGVGAQVVGLTIAPDQNVGIGTTVPTSKLHIMTASNGASTVGTASDELILENSADCGLTIRSGSSDDGVISFADADDHNVGQVYYSHSNNSMTFRTNDSTAMTVTSAGNLGIGTTAAAQKLHVVGSAIIDGGTGVASTGVLNVRQSGDTLNNGIALTSSHGTSHRIWKDSAGKLNFGPTSLPSAFVQDLTGKVGIGTTAPNRKLHISGSGATVAVKVEATDGVQSSLDLKNSEGEFRLINDGGALSIYDQTDTAERFRIDTSGKVGIGTTVPYNKLHVNGTGRINSLMVGDASAANTPAVALHVKSSATNARIRIEDSDSSNDYWDFYVNQGDGLHFQEDGTNRVTFKTGGNVGIGTTSPTSQLHLHKDAGTAYLKQTNTANGQTLEIGNAYSLYTGANGAHSAIASDEVLAFATADAERMRIDISGRLLLNATSTAFGDKLYVNGDAYVTGGWRTGTGATFVGELTNSSGILTLQSAANRDIQFGDSGTPAIMYIDTSTEYVGIGTTSPTQKLEVVGTVTATGLNVDVPDGGSAPATTAIIKIHGYEGRGAGIQIRDSVNSAASASNREWFVGSGYSGSHFNIGYAADGVQSSYTAQSKLIIAASTGNVGIGTASPDAKLRIDQDVGTVGLKVTGGSGGVSIAEFIRDVGGTTSVAISGESARPQMKFTSAGNTFALGVNSNTFEIADNAVLGTNTRFSITNAGNVGIGTSTPVAKLHVQGSLSNSTGNATSQVQMRDRAVFSIKPVTDNSGTLHFAQVDSGNSIGMQFTNSAANATWDLSLQPFAGNVGIGTTAPASKLHVRDGDLLIQKGTGTTSVSELGFTNAFDTAFLRSSYTNPSATTETYLAFHTNTSGATNGTVAEQMRIVGNKVAIGTTAPTEKLHIHGGGIYTTPVTYAGNQDHWALKIGASNNAGWDFAGIKLRVDSVGIPRMSLMGPGQAEAVSIVSSSVGIGTNAPKAKLQVEELGIDTTTTSTTAVTQVAIDSMVAATFRSARYTIQVTNSTDSTYHLTEMLLIHDGATPSINEFGTIFTGSAAEAAFTADINSGNVRILATPASTDAMAFKVVRHSITV